MKSYSTYLADHLVVAIFLLLLSCIGILTVSNITLQSSSFEKRRLAPFPEIPRDSNAINSWPLLFEKFINDRFGMRGDLARINARIRVDLLKTSPSDKVVVGQKGWLYYSGQEAMSSPLFTADQALYWREAVKAKRAWLQSMGIGYLFVVVPEKHHIYSEFLPRNHLASETSNYAILRPIMPVSVMPDLYKLLLDAKNTHEVYYHTDSHFNSYGAYLVCRELLRYFPYPVKLQEAEGYPDATTTSFNNGDLAITLQLNALMVDKEVKPVLGMRQTEYTTAKQMPNMIPDMTITKTFAPLNSSVRVMVLHDSFFEKLRPFFSPMFGEVTYISSQSVNTFNCDMIRKDQPNFVIEEIAERYLREYATLPPEIVQWLKSGDGKGL